jgi:glyoxylase-like metal-dependent hydrolase (beta-lactamase superfamily II)
LTPELIEPGLWRIPLPMPSGPPFVNIYLVRSEDGWILVDTGFGVPGIFDELADGFAYVGVVPADLRQILLTHVHPDHGGNAPRLSAMSGAPIRLHTADAELLKWILRPGSAERMGERLLDAGAEPAKVAETVEACTRLFSLFPPLPDALPLRDGESIPTALGPLEVIHTPGHSPGHVCFYLRERGVLLSGDTVLEGIFPNVGIADGHDCFGEFLATLDRLQTLPEPRILPAHGLPFGGLDAWCVRTRADALKRLRRVRTLREEGLTPAAITRRLWDRDLRPFDLQLALTTVLGQILHLDRIETEQALRPMRIS